MLCPHPGRTHHIPKTIMNLQPEPALRPKSRIRISEHYTYAYAKELETNGGLGPGKSRAEHC
jgi:hypothetical protein